jgi:SAM-dependent methyltransferase
MNSKDQQALDPLRRLKSNIKPLITSGFFVPVVLGRQISKLGLPDPCLDWSTLDPHNAMRNAINLAQRDAALMNNNKARNAMTQPRCPACDAPHTTHVVTIPSVPVFCNVLLNSAPQARAAAQATIELVCCNHCHHLFNRAFDSQLLAYAPGYDASLFFSPTYQEYAKVTAHDLIERHHLIGKTLLEIGCGDGRYLELICKLGNNRGVGMDPGCDFSHRPPSDQLQFSSDLFGQGASAYQPDFILCRHVLEHLESPQTLIQDVYHVLSQTNGTLYFEVPNANYTLDDLGIWDLIYEHVSYFTPQSIYRLFTQNGFEITQLSCRYGNQFLCLEAAIPSSSTHASSTHAPLIEPPTLAEQPSQQLAAFKDNFERKTQVWRERLAQCHQRGERVVLWGTGSKGVTFLNVCDTDNLIDYVIDINPSKTGKYTPGTGHQVFGPEAVSHRPPQHVLIMNPVYHDEIQSNLKERGIHAQLHLV